MPKIGIHQIAKVAGVSIGTVDRALHGRGRIKESTRKLVLQVAQDLGYRPNLAARALSVGRATIHIGLCLPREDHFYDQIRLGLVSEARRYEHLGIEFIYGATERLGVGELEQTRALLERDIQALIIAPGDHKLLTPLINEAEERNIRVVCVATDAPETRRSTVICVEPELNGRLAGELMGRLVCPKSQVAIITGILQAEDHRKKVQGFSEVFPQVCPEGKVMEVLEGHEDEDETFLKCENLLHRLQNLSGLYVSTAICLPVCRALNALHLNGRLKLVTTDLFREMIPYFEKGTIIASIYQRPYVQGQNAVRLIVDHIVHGQPIPRTHYLNPSLVMHSNLYLFREIRHPEVFSVHDVAFETLDGSRP
ncbi:MAG: substrate-binding domain-containing protein [Terriglobia bacterium]